jgi:hypothetical protein
LCGYHPGWLGALESMGTGTSLGSKQCRKEGIPGINAKSENYESSINNYYFVYT